MLRGKVKQRIQRIFLCAVLIFACILSKLAVEQIVHHDAILERAMDLWQRDFAVAGTRGTIYSSDGTVLAQDIPATSVVVVPSQIEDPEHVAKQLADILEADEQALYEKLTRKQSTQKLQPEGRLINDEQADAIEALELQGVYLVQDSLRYYPRGDYLGQVLGFTGIDNQGLAGLELQYDELLKAQQGSLKIHLDAKGNHVTLLQETYEASGSGMDLTLTIDANIQDIMEREMRNLMKRYKPQRALALAMDPNTGAILGMVSQPGFDPNHYDEYEQETINQNLPVWMSLAPPLSRSPLLPHWNWICSICSPIRIMTAAMRSSEEPGSNHGAPAAMACRRSCRCWKIHPTRALSRSRGVWAQSGCMNM